MKEDAMEELLFTLALVEMIKRDGFFFETLKGKNQGMCFKKLRNLKKKLNLRNFKIFFKKIVNVAKKVNVTKKVKPIWPTCQINFDQKNLICYKLYSKKSKCV